PATAAMPNYPEKSVPYLPQFKFNVNFSPFHRPKLPSSRKRRSRYPGPSDSRRPGSGAAAIRDPATPVVPEAAQPLSGTQRRSRRSLEPDRESLAAEQTQNPAHSSLPPVLNSARREGALATAGRRHTRAVKSL